MTAAQKAQCHTIIHIAATASAGAGAGMTQVPCSDAAVIVPIQLAMIVTLATVFNIALSRTMAEATFATKAATLVGRGVSQVLLGWVPGLGNALNAATAAGVTEAIGWSVAKDFDRIARQ